MADPTTVNTSLAVPVRGTDTGTWDVPVNGNFTSIDSMMGGVTTIALTSSPVTLLTSQALVNVIRLTGTLTSSAVTITLPGIYKSWTIDNQIVNSPSSFAVTLISTSGTSIIGCPPGTQDVFYDGTTVNYRNLGRVGEYWDYAASVVPTWVTASTKPPYLNCNATTFSSATYPILANLLGTTTLPDSRGRVRATMDQGTTRISGVIGSSVVGNAGGDQNLQAHAHTGSGTTSGQSNDHTHAYTGAQNISTTGGGGFATGFATAGNTGGVSADHSHTYSFTTTTAGAGASQNVQPTYIGGICMIRAA
jgi:hypothetical protein